MTGKRSTGRVAAVFFLLCLLLAGCRRAEFAGIHRVAVLTPDNRTSSQELGIEIKHELLRVLPSRLAAEVIDGAAVEAELPAGEYAAGLQIPGVAVDLGARYGVDAFLVGTVTDYREEAEEHFSLEAGTGERMKAEIRVDLRVTLGFNLTLVRAADGAVVFSRYAWGSAVHPLSLGLIPPSISLTVSAEPIYPRLRKEAIRDALQELLKEVARSSGR
ncbi:MAG: hypothetical protein GX493_12830 [Firmicutes bacterium]|nr:hypothetical protein [Bacillota bacterium]